ncbi:hypothetical protein [Lentiprolixibacter aurantiacus]|uniref:Uncharacterized protein n=1 Tax=Lentiprolixibacter aurantiacus TaxID=2993939 RepID=A0AAE3MME9_9FLAO|nr:hypothetical protein [Lentiprolixibacter aurantiacus]MCX2719559.1 hypothetical protein [Lentiprolixibacter aurantiacus]
MSILSRASSWKLSLLLSILLLLVLIVFNFYGLYTARFYFLKIDNYIFLLLAIIHFKYIQMLWLKISENGYPDSKIRNLEYGLYPILFVYAFKASETTYLLLNASNFEEYLLPRNFLPIGITVLGMQIALILLTFLSFSYRRRKIGVYNFDKINENIDSWQ